MMIMNLNVKQQGALGLCAAFAALLCFTTILALWQWHDDWVLAHQEIKTAPTVSADQTATLIAAIPSEHLFGKSISNEVPLTNLQLRVTGIVKVENDTYGSYSKAYISISGQPGKIFQVGDSLPYGVKIEAITSDAVILENDGRMEKLLLPREKLQFKPVQTEESW